MNKTDLPIAEPCGASWTDMIGADAARFCGACSRVVHDLSQMTEGEARSVLRAPATRGLCVRYLHAEDGTIVFRAAAPEPKLIAPTMLARAKRVAIAAAALVAPMSLMACKGAMPPPPPPPPPPASVALMGAPPAAPPAAATDAPADQEAQKPSR